MADIKRLRFLLPLALLATAHAGPAEAKKPFKTIYSFCANGACPFQPIDLIADASDTLYGISAHGGKGNEGVAFELVPNAQKSRWKYKAIWNFCANAKCKDGGAPQGGLIVDVTGNLYGTTTVGGAQGVGSLFRLSPNGKKWTLTTLYDFCSQANCIDSPPSYRLTYAGAASGAPYDGTSPLYGAYYAGINGGTGAAFSFTPQPGQWTQTTIYNFCTVGFCQDGSLPESILADTSGNLYGTTLAGGFGEDNAGVVFELSPAGGGWTEIVLHSFCRSCTDDGQFPQGAIAIDGSGNIYGTTTNQGQNGKGVIFKLVPNGTNSTESVLYNFCPKGDCSASGSAAFSGIVSDAQGHLYGAAASNGAQGGGTLFTPNPNFKVLHAFCGCSGDGASPATASVDSLGNVFGLTLAGGDENSGTVFELAK